jgi:hypothetical protein
MDKPIFVVVASYGGPPGCTKEDGTRYGPIVMETDVDEATLEVAQDRAAALERGGYGACRVGRVVFDDVPQPTPAPTPQPPEPGPLDLPF